MSCSSSSSSSSSSGSNHHAHHKNFVYVNPATASNYPRLAVAAYPTAEMTENNRHRFAPPSYEFHSSFDEAQTNRSTDLMIYLNLKETVNKIDFSDGFSQFIVQHYRDNPAKFYEQIRQFNYFREVC